MPSTVKLTVYSVTWTPPRGSNETNNLQLGKGCTEILGEGGGGVKITLTTELFTQLRASGSRPDEYLLHPMIMKFAWSASENPWIHSESLPRGTEVRTKGNPPRWEKMKYSDGLGKSKTGDHCRSTDESLVSTALGVFITVTGKPVEARITGLW